ncbi:MAG: metal ABC transporter permease [Bacteroidia bacterium]
MSSISELQEVFGYAYAQRALLASILVGISCGMLGVFIVLRNMSLIGDALSHAILPGVVVGFMIAGHSIFAFFTGSVIAGLVAALSITWLQQHVKTKEDAAIGIVFSAMFALGIIGISAVTRQEGVHLDMKDFLFGNVLGISNQDLWLTGLITFYVGLSLLAFYRFFFVTTFQSVMAQTTGINTRLMHYFMMMLLSFTVVASLQSVGVILVVAMLIIPASTALLLSSRLKVVLLLSAITGLLSASCGLILAILWETTPGPAMTLVATSFYILAMLLSPRKGLLLVRWRKYKRQQQQKAEDLLKEIVKLQEKNVNTLSETANTLGLTARQLQKGLNHLQKLSWLESCHSGTIHLSAAGLQRAYALIRAHRLWESYLVTEVGLQSDQIHNQAEQYEHRLPEGLLHQLDAQLGFPVYDPHGSPIPQQLGTAVNLSSLEAGETALLLTDQVDSSISLQLWKLGISANQLLVVKQLDEQTILLNDGKNIPLILARQVLVRKL